MRERNKRRLCYIRYTFDEYRIHEKKGPRGSRRKARAPDARKFLTKFLKSGVRRKIKNPPKRRQSYKFNVSYTLSISSCSMPMYRSVIRSLLWLNIDINNEMSTPCLYAKYPKVLRRLCGLNCRFKPALVAASLSRRNTCTRLIGRFPPFRDLNRQSSSAASAGTNVFTASLTALFRRNCFALPVFCSRRVIVVLPRTSPTFSRNRSDTRKPVLIAGIKNNRSRPCR